MTRLALSFGLCLVFGGVAYGQDTDPNAAGKGPDFKIIEPDDEIARRAREAAEWVRRKGMADITPQMSDRARKALGVIESGAKSETVTTDSPQKSFQAILFASQSIPRVVLRRYARQLAKVNGVIVFRGVPGGLSKLGPLLELTQSIILEDPDCKRPDCAVYDVGVLLDPLIFRENQVTHVPAVMIVDRDPFRSYCQRPDDEKAASVSRFITYGDAHFTGHLEALEKQGDRRASLLLRAFEEEVAEP
ncbi:TrbC family F-type conjugative pilus assembly protein [Eilatimonas milleporae]|uniref:Type-F conjugative transfer system pilin assembly protein TrbC n=1 Tax=Eilatimonas milleporae TaxID=911205 RepID=A0A3M0C5C5_9PROT|nr:TrbC family F-type conjugative pilus assembly protein [Eilatimonas milleporae]RMB05051.1 type-F conjugative transfer system pilin assembly protein TrbC [Eilatimonas milleporae]